MLFHAFWANGYLLYYPFSISYFRWICCLSLSPSSLYLCFLTGNWQVTGACLSASLHFYRCSHSLNLSLIWEVFVLSLKYFCFGFLGMKGTQVSNFPEPYRSSSLQHSGRWVIEFFNESGRKNHLWWFISFGFFYFILF